MSSLGGSKGFTIVELLIVVVVIAILAAITIVSYTGIQKQARDSVRKNDAATIAKSLRLWSYNTGKQFSAMNVGNGGPAANGWFDAGYSATPSVKDVLAASQQGISNLADPLATTAVTNKWRYMVTPCTADVNDNRRVVLVELENAPSQTLMQQLASQGCNSTYITSYEWNYGVNYAVVADAR